MVSLKKPVHKIPNKHIQNKAIKHKHHGEVIEKIEFYYSNH
jgi:hypothetical protein